MNTKMKLIILFLTCLTPAAAWWKDMPVCYAPAEKFIENNGNHFLFKELTRLAIPCNCPWGKICSSNHPRGAQYNTQQLKDFYGMQQTTHACYPGDCDAAKTEMPQPDPTWVKGQYEMCSAKFDQDAGNAFFWAAISYGVQCKCKWSDVCTNPNPNGAQYNSWTLQTGSSMKGYCTGKKGTEPCQDKGTFEEAKKAEEDDLGMAATATTSLTAIVLAGVGAALM